MPLRYSRREKTGARISATILRYDLRFRPGAVVTVDKTAS
jgi:hypothetical protein